MKLDRLLVLFAVLLSVTATMISSVALMRDPLGTNLSKYNLSSPEATLRSVNSMVAGQDLRAAWQFFKTAIQSESGPEMKIFFSDDAKIAVLKSIEVSNSINPKNNGTIISFVKCTVAGVDYYSVQYFKKDPSNRFSLGGSFYIPYGTQGNEQDKAIESAIEKFKKTGKL
jgi:hypothetical protein